MVVHTQTDRVHQAQRAVVEFLLINHPLDCPVCDKGGECPLQDITYGWGPGTSRFIEPKRHFKKPLELSPLIAIDRERCILCYRCVRFSQEVSEDYQLILLERGAHSFVGTFDGHPYVGAVLRQHRRAVPGRRAHLARLPLPRAAVGHRGRGHGLHAVPVAVQRRADRPRRPRDARAGARPRGRRRRLAVRQGPLRLPAHARRRAHHAAARARGHAADARRRGRRRSPPPPARSRRRARRRGRAGRRRDHQRGGVPARSACSARASARRTSAPRTGGELPLDAARALADPALQATVADLECANTVLLLDCDPIDDAPIWDLRIRKGVRRHGSSVAVASARPTALDAHADAVLRHAPGAGEALLVGARRRARRATRATSAAAPPPRAPTPSRCASWRSC